MSGTSAPRVAAHLDYNARGPLVLPRAPSPHPALVLPRPPPPHPVPLYTFKAPNGVWIPDSHLSPFSSGIRVPDSNWRIPDSHLHVPDLHLRPFSSGNPGSGFELEDPGFSLARSGFSSVPILFGEFRLRIRTEGFRPFTCGCRTPTFLRSCVMQRLVVDIQDKVPCPSS